MASNTLSLTDREIGYILSSLNATEGASSNDPRHALARKIERNTGKRATVSANVNAARWAVIQAAEMIADMFPEDAATCAKMQSLAAAWADETIRIELDRIEDAHAAR